MRRYWLALLAAAALPLALLAVPATGAAAPGVTIYACINGSHQFTHVSVTGPLACPGQSPVSWPGNGPSPTPTPTPTPSPSPSPSPTVPVGACVVTGANDSCPFAYAGITGSSVWTTYVNQDVWNQVPGWSQTLTAYDPGNWSVAADVANASGSVVSYPDVQQLETSQPLSSLTSVTSTFAEQMNPTAVTAAEAAYDVWLNNWGNEIMLWVDATPAQQQALGYDTALGSYTAPDGSGWSVYRNGAASCNSCETILSLNQNEQAGTVDILTALQWLQGQGLEPASSTLTGIDFGWEISATGGQDETFTMSGYTLTVG